MKAFSKSITKEQMVRSFLEANGFAVTKKESDNSNGIDIVAMKNGRYFTIEVKKVNYSKRSRAVDGLGKSGMISDYVALVGKYGAIMFYTREDHLKLCSKNGSRSVGKLMNLVDEIETAGDQSNVQ